MSASWNVAKQMTLLFAGVLLACWAVALVYYCVMGDIGIFRAGIKLVVVAGLMAWLHDMWLTLARR